MLSGKIFYMLKTRPKTQLTVLNENSKTIIERQLSRQKLSKFQ